MQDIKIIAQTEDYVVINKPAGILVHKTNRKDFDEETIVDWVLENFPQAKEVGDEPEIRPGIVHRLDRDVSGVMVIALNQETFLDIKQQFKSRNVEKEYIALAHGEFSQPEGEINFSISRKTKSGKMAAHPDDQGREALTKYLVIETKKRYSLLKLNIETGRTNQIRVHLNAISHPIVGDFVYRPKKLKPRKGEKELKRAFLHCAKLGFYAKDSQKVTFEAELATELDYFYKNL